MVLPLQPALTPPPPWWRRTLALGSVFAALGVIALLSGPRLQPPRLLADGPGRDPQALGAAVRLISGAQQYVWVAMYVVRPDDDGPVHELLAGLAEAHRRGVDVRVVLDLDDQETGKNQAATDWLRGQGIRVVLDETKITSHGKVLLVDGRQALVGSHNWTRSALTKNREVSVILVDATSLADLAAWFAEVPGWAEGNP